MAMGIISKDVLTDIANAIREQNGTAKRYLPGEMAAAVLALDGTDAGGAYDAPETGGSGLISDTVFAAIADAIRAQNGLTATYTPPEMGDAIRALVWDTGVKLRALLLADGTLEFNYRDGRSTDLGAAIVGAWEVDPAGYAEGGDRPWDGSKGSAVRAVIDADVAGSGLSSTAHWFEGFSKLVEVRGFENLAGVGSMAHMFVSCPSLLSIYSRGWAGGTVDGPLMFSACNRLVGAQGFVPGQATGAEALGFGEEGALTDPDADPRLWLRVHGYADGEVVFTAAGEPDAGREFLATGVLCAQARYQAVDIGPWQDHAHGFTRATFAADMGTFPLLNMDYWLYGYDGLTRVDGLANLANVSEMRHTFNSCSSLPALDFRRFDPSGLSDLTYTFGGCGALGTIVADADWELPSGVTGFGCFYQARSLVGGNGTAYSGSRIAATYMRIDREGQQGYLTAG